MASKGTKRTSATRAGTARKPGTGTPHPGKTIAVYAGTFDPPTLGHVDVVRRGLSLFDEIIVAIGHTPAKKPTLALEERVELLGACFRDEPRVRVETFEGLLIDFCAKRGAKAILRGLRVVSDFDYEFQLGLANRDLDPGIETVFVLAAKEHIFVSSSIVREIASHGHPVGKYVPGPVAKAMARKGKRPERQVELTATERRTARAERA